MSPAGSTRSPRTSHQPAGGLPAPPGPEGRRPRRRRRGSAPSLLVRPEGSSRSEGSSKSSGRPARPTEVRSRGQEATWPPSPDDVGVRRGRARRGLRAFTEAANMVRWMAESAVLDAPLTASSPSTSRASRCGGVTGSCTPQPGLVFSWGFAGSDDLPPGASTVEVLLSEESGGTRVETCTTGSHRSGRRGTPRVGKYLDRLALAAIGWPPWPPGHPEFGNQSVRQTMGRRST